MRTVSWEQVNDWRLAQHFLLKRAKRNQMLDVVERVGALQAQVMSAAELQLWARVDGLKPSDVQDALWKKRSLVKAWVLRGTLHLVTAEDYPIYVAALSSFLLKFYRRGSWLKYHQVTLDEIQAVERAIDETLADKEMTRRQLAETVATRTGNPHLQTLLESGWGALLKPAAAQGLICFGASEGQNVTFYHPKHWIGEWDAVETETAYRALARRYLTAYGPASAEDFGHWLGMQPADAKKAFKLLGDEIEPVEVEGWKAWALSETLATLERSERVPSVRLLPYFDPYVLSASKHSDYILDAAHKAKVYRAQGWISPVVLVNGRIEGVWEHSIKRGKVTVTITPFAKPGKTIKAGIEAEVARLGAFYEMESQVEFAHQAIKETRNVQAGDD